MEPKYCKESRVVHTDLVLPNDTNNHNTLFGGVLMKRIDGVASISAKRHCRAEVVTASTDSVDFLEPILPTDSICIETFVTWTGRTSMEVFAKVITEDLLSGKRRIAATAFLTFVALDENGKPVAVPEVIPETPEEQKLHETGDQRALVRKNRRAESKKLAQFITTKKPWE
ncbi:MAG TPA: acyl-CoA thioesterase [Bacillus sp. (in: firmicutes)]|uniref:acyl-CoA thioesterase n=1 Tax=Bacillus litorisediminis TaxID=2922713 RepID=UPI001FABF256|nr:acyl-CoA thioesterase [Bacillus litorisediminis]HWO78146.1 acyl-CoA thioesterase [Bacillus sp. (in: firmicutes)]